MYKYIRRTAWRIIYCFCDLIIRVIIGLLCLFAPLWIFLQRKINILCNYILFSFNFLLPCSIPYENTNKKPIEIVMLVRANLRCDQRVQREALVLVHSGFHNKILVSDNHTPPLAEAPLDWPPGIQLLLLPPNAGAYTIDYPYLFGRMMLNKALH